MPVCKLITYQNPLYAKDGAGKFFDEDSYMDIYNYVRGNSHCSGKGNYAEKRKEKMPNNIYGSRCIDFYNAPGEMETVARAFGKFEGTKLRHYILSLGPKEIERLGSSLHTCNLILEDVAEHFLDAFHGEYQCYYTIHEDTDCPHVHIIQSTVNHQTGKKFPGDKKSYFGIANELNSYLREAYGMQLQMVPDDR